MSFNSNNTAAFLQREGALTEETHVAFCSHRVYPVYLLYTSLPPPVSCTFGSPAETIKGTRSGILNKYEIRLWSCFYVGGTLDKKQVSVPQGRLLNLSGNDLGMKGVTLVRQCREWTPAS